MALTERYAPNLHGVLSCYDRIIVTGTLPGACYAGGMTSFLYSRGAYFSPSWTAFQADRGRDFSVIVDGVSG